MNVSSTGSSASDHVTSGASAPMSPSQKMADLFDAIDSSGSGSISQDQFAQAFQTLNPPPSFQAAGADAIWKQLDPNGTGSVSKSDFVSTMTTLMKQLRGHHHHKANAGGSAQVAQAASTLANLGSKGSTSDTSSSGSVGTLLDLLA